VDDGAHISTFTATERRHALADFLARPSASRTIVGVALLVSLAAGFRIYHLGAESLWVDEAFSWRFALLPLSTLWGETLDLHPPLYYSLQKIPLLFSDSEASLRSVAAAIGVADVILAFVLGKRLGGENVGWLSGLLVATSTLAITYSQEARSYSLLTMAVIVSAIGVAGLLSAQRHAVRGVAPDNAMFVGGAVVALYSHNLAVLYFGLTAAYVAAVLIVRRSYPLLRLWLLSVVAVVVGWSWWLPTMLSQGSHSGTLTYLSPPDLWTIIGLLYIVYGQPFIVPFVGLLFMVAMIAGAVAGRRSAAIMHLSLITIGIPAAEIVISYLGQPIFMIRSLAWLTPLCLILVAYGTLRIKRASVAGAAVTVLIVAQLATAHDYFETPSKEAWRELVTDVAARMQPGDAVVVSPVWSEVPIGYYWERLGLRPAALVDTPDTDWNEWFAVWRDHGLLRAPMTSDGDRLDALKAHPRIWVLTRWVPAEGLAASGRLVKDVTVHSLLVDRTIATIIERPKVAAALLVPQRSSESTSRH
jgi:mannosyltransferase